MNRPLNRCVNRCVNRPAKHILTFALALSALGLGGCSSLRPVQPWEKGDLARQAMGFETDRVDAAFVEHTYSSKEGVFGGAGVGGGGCGCN